MNKTKVSTGQSRLESLFETFVNTGTGFVLAMLTNYLLLPAFDIEISIAQNAVMTLVFTVVSVIRGYAIRRLFNYLKTKG